jgi:serine/threonine-protein kinase RsbT
MQFDFTITGGDFSNAGAASSSIKKLLKQLNIEPQIIKRVVVALYEAEVNVVAHAYQGTITVKIDSEKILMKVEDEGPGIEDIELAMQEGYSTASHEVREMGFGAGMGLSNIKKNADHFSIQSTVDKGTKLDITTKFN